MATDNESLSEMSQYYQTHQEELQKMLNVLNPNAAALLDETDTIDDDEKSMDLTRQSSITSYAGSVSIFQDEYLHHRSLKHLSDDQTDLNKLLNRDSDDSDSSGPLQAIRKIKTNFFTKRFSSRRSSKKSDKQDDSISIKSNTSDNSRLSLVDIKNEFKKLRRLKKPKFRKPVVVNKDDEGEGMASILARSVIHAHTSLACIAETQDSEHSPGSTMRRTSESEPNINISDPELPNITTENADESVKALPEIRFTSLSNINSEDAEPKRERKISESCPATPMPLRSDNLLTLPGEDNYFGSISSALSAESSELDSRDSSTDEDDESSDLKTDTERSIETTSSVVQSVLSHEADPVLIANMDKKLSDLENATPEPKSSASQEIKQEHAKKLEVEQQVFHNQLLIDKCKSLESVPFEIENKKLKEKPVKSNEASTTSMKDETCVAKPSSHHIKFHNPFAHKKASKSISEPSSPVEKNSFVHRSSRRIRRQFSKLSKSNMIKSISHYSLHPKKKDVPTPLSQPGSSSDIHSKAPSDTVLGSPFLSFNDLLSLDKETHDNNKFFHKSDEFDRSKFSMYIGSEPVSRASISGPSFPYAKEEHHEHHKKSPAGLKPTGLLHTAMETILLDKVQNLLIPASPDPDTVKTQQFFADVNEKLGKVEEDRNKVLRKESMERKLQPLPLTIKKVPPVNTKPVIVSTLYKKDKNPGLVQTAMETMLIDRVQSVLAASTPDSQKPELIFTEPQIGEKQESSKSKLKKPLGLIHSILGPKSSEPASPTEKSFDSKKKKERKSSGLIHTAMETMLMEKVQSVLGPETPEPTYVSVFDGCDLPKTHNKQNDTLKPSGLVQTAVETMLLDRVQTSALGANVPDPVIPTEDTDNKSIKSKDEQSSGLTHTAMETILMDKVQSLVGQPGLAFVVPKPEDESEKHKKSSKDDLRPKGLIKTAVETILLDRLHASELGTQIPEPVIEPENTESKSTKQVNKGDETSGLTHTAMETILMDKVHALVGQPGMTFVEPQTFTDDELEKAEHINDDLKSPGLVQTAVQTILLDKVQTLVGNSESAVEQPRGDTPSKYSNDGNLKPDGLVHTAFETILLDKVQSLVPTESEIVIAEPNKNNAPEITGDSMQGSLINTAVQTILMDKVKAMLPATDTDEDTKTEKESKSVPKVIEKSKSVPEPQIKSKKLIRQDSIHSVTDKDTPKMSDKPNSSPCEVTKMPAHPTMGVLATIPSLPEGSIDHEAVEDTNISVCDNSHAVCGVNRSERDKRAEDKCDKDRGSPRHARHESYGGREPPPTHAQNSSLNASSTPMGIHRRSSDSDLSVTPKGKFAVYMSL